MAAVVIQETVIIVKGIGLTVACSKDATGKPIVDSHGGIGLTVASS